MLKKINLPITISIISVVISALALYLAFIVHKESTSVVFTWEVRSRNDIPIKLKQERVGHVEGRTRKTELESSIPLWLQYKVANLGSRTFSVDSIFVVVEHIKPDLEIFDRMFIPLGTSLSQGRGYAHLSSGISTKDKIVLPIAIEPGHSKVMFSKFDLPIPLKLYNAYKKEFKGQDFILLQVNRLDDDYLHISSHYYVTAEVTLSGGEVKVVRVDMDELVREVSEK